MLFLAPLAIVILFVFAFNKEKVHTYKAVVTKQGDCSNPGLRTYTCVRCGYTCFITSYSACLMRRL